MDMSVGNWVSKAGVKGRGLGQTYTFGSHREGLLFEAMTVEEITEKSSKY